METGFPPSSIAITGFGAITPAGEDANQSFISFRAGIVAIAEHAYITCTPEEPEWDLPLPLFAAPVPALDPMQQGIERFVQLAIPALEQVLAQSALQRSALPNTGLFVVVPQSQSDTADLGLQQGLGKRLCKRMGLASLNHVQVFCSGHTGTTEALLQAAKLLRAGPLQHAIILAVDTYLLEERIAHYDAQWRIKNERNVDGFTPGEAACALMIEPAATAIERQATIHGYLHGGAFGHEAHNRLGDKSSTGEGLRQAIDGALKGRENVDFVHFYSDFNGESYYAYEMGLLQSRFPTVFEGLQAMFYPATCFGDTGAVGTTLAILLACYEGLKEEASKGFNLITSADDSGKRAALLLQTV